MLSGGCPSGACTVGAIQYDPLAGSVSGQDFVAHLFGDCTGNWVPSGGSGAAAGLGVTRLEPGRVEVRGRWVVVPLRVTAPEGYVALEVELAYDPAEITPVRLLRRRAGAGQLAMLHTPEAGRVRLAVASAEPIAAEAPLAVLFAAAGQRRPEAHGVHVTTAHVE